MSAVVLENLTLGYERRPAVHHLSGGFAGQRLHAVVGPNGSGKSTLLKGLAGVLTPLSGSIRLDHVGRSQVAYLPQDHGVDRSFPLTIGDLVGLGLWSRRGLFGAISPTDRRRIHEALEAVGLDGFENRGLDQVSGGQLQRALFARVLVQDARLILLDEPFTALDEATIADLTAVIRRWPGEGRTVVMVLHDLDLVRRLCSDALLLAREPIAWGRTAEVLTAEHLAAARRRSEAWSDHPHLCHAETAA